MRMAVPGRRTIVRKQADTGIDIVTDGEMSRPGFFTYVRERLTGFEATARRESCSQPQVAAFPEYYAEYFKQAHDRGRDCPGRAAGLHGSRQLRRAQAFAATRHRQPQGRIAGVKHEAVFMPAVAPSGVGRNEHYRTDEEYFHAVGDALRTEYQAIVDAGFLLQVDDPFLSDIFCDPELDAEQRRTAQPTICVEAINHSLRGIPAEKVRFHTCYGINEGPRIHEAPTRRTWSATCSRSTPAPTRSKRPTRATSTTIISGRP